MLQRILKSVLVLFIATLRPSSHCAADSTVLFDETECTTLFAFDQVSIPFTQNLRLEMREPVRHSENPVVRRGDDGTPDVLGVQFYGSVIREQDRFRMWYVAVGNDVEQTPSASERYRAAYAESTDGFNWTKPDLGLVEYKGSRHNNLIETSPGRWGFVNLKVLKDDRDEDPSRRYKISTHAYYRYKSRLGTLAPFVSSDGLHWKMLAEAVPLRGELDRADLVLPAIHFEPCGGLYFWKGMYYIVGQNAMNAPLPYQGRISRSYRSKDFLHWSTTSNVAFTRSTQQEYLGSGRSLEGEQNHEGISVWNRRNVLLGLYGRWHGDRSWENITVDLGFVLSNDGLHFREAVQEWTFLKRGPDGAWDQGGLLQGQGFENVGEQTLIYYGAWDPRQTGKLPVSPRGGVGIAILPRDRFGSLVVEKAGEGDGPYQQPEVVSELMTSALESNTFKRGIHLNVEGLSDEAVLKAELLTEDEVPVVGFSGDDAAIVCKNGFQSQVVWAKATISDLLPERVKLRLVYQGKRKTEIRLSAIYLLGDG